MRLLTESTINDMKAMYQRPSVEIVVEKTYITALVIAAVVCVLLFIAAVIGALQLWRKHKVRIHACAKHIT